MHNFYQAHIKTLVTIVMSDPSPLKRMSMRKPITPPGTNHCIVEWDSNGPEVCQNG